MKARSTAGAVDPCACDTVNVKMIWFVACVDCTAVIVAVRLGCVSVKFWTALTAGVNVEPEIDKTPVK